MENQTPNPAAETNATLVEVQKDNRALHEVKGEEREELGALSKEVFGSSSRWQTLITKGHPELVTEEVEEYVPGETDKDGKVGEGFNRKAQIPVKRKDGALQYTHKYHDVTSVKAYMIERKVQLDKIKAEVKHMQDEAKAKKEAEVLAKKIHQEAQGSAV